MASYSMDGSFTYGSDKDGVYYTDSNFTNFPLFTEQELYCFLTAEQNIFQNMDGARMGVYPQFPEMDGYCDGGIVPMQGCYSMGVQDGYMSAEEDAFSCQPSPFLGQQYPRPPFMNTQSPITPSGSPLASEHSADFFSHSSAPSFLLVPEYQSDQTGEYSFEAPVSFDSVASLPSSQTPASDSSCQSSPALGSPGSDDDDDDEEEEYESDLSLLPNQGNKELRGMGLYDSPPDLLHTNCSTPAGCSPISPHLTLGKGLVLERSFGLPEEMMEDGSFEKLAKGRFEVEDEEEEPMMYDQEESGDWDGVYQSTYQPQYDVSFYTSQANRGW